MGISNLFQGNRQTHHESRRDPRVNDAFPIQWKLKDGHISGMGTICNISASGLLLKAKAGISLSKDSILEFKPKAEAQLAYVPNLGRIVWSKSKGFLSGASLLGIEFVNPPQEILGNLRTKISQKMEKIVYFQKIKDKIGWFLFIFMTVLAVGVLSVQVYNYRNFAHSSQMLLSSSTQQANLYSETQTKYRALEAVHVEIIKELNNTRALLSETETYLAQARKQNQSFSQEIKKLKGKDIFAELAAIQKENEWLKGKLDESSQQLKRYQGNIESIEEGRMAIVLHKDYIHSIKIQLNRLKRKIRLARIEAQKERDSLLLKMGNRGFVIKEGKSFNPPFPRTESERKVLIDVQVVK